MIRRAWVAAVVVMAAMFQPPTLAQNTHDLLETTVADHPAADVLRQVFGQRRAAPEDFKPTGMTRQDYLPLIAGNVDYWKRFQNERGEIIDPYEGEEKQYSTPAFALAASLLVIEARRADLLDRATRALSRSLEELVTKQTADLHADFYIPMLMHARRLLKDKVERQVLAKWDEQLKSIVPETIYRDTTGGANWNVVNVSGEYLRRKDKLVADDQREAQLAYLDKCLKVQSKRFTPFGFYVDPSAPLAYDAFPRLWLDDALADDAIEGSSRDELETWLGKGALAGLLLISPSGEWPHGGRSAHHQWNEAENAAIAEISAPRWKKAGRADIAGGFKRAAHLCLSSMYRWQRPSGEMWIVKNFADPARRHGFESYSFHSQYNLLPMAMLSIAYLRADDAIEETPMPSESAGYVFNFHETFHHIAAAAGGYYILIDTSADPHYGSTGLQRVHRAGVELSPLTDTPAPEDGYGPPEAKARAAISVGLQWKSDDGNWHSVADYGVPPPPRNPDATAPAKPENYVEKIDVRVKEQSPQRVVFSIRYQLQGEAARPVEEEYIISKDGIEGLQRIGGDAASAHRVVFPALVNDGARATELSIDGKTLTLTRRGALTRDLKSEKKDWVTKRGGSLTWTLLTNANVTLSLMGPDIATHNGYVRAVVADLPSVTREIRWKLTLHP